jgi:RNA polymerase sigma-70 factor (ECF subfamily)
MLAAMSLLPRQPLLEDRRSEPTAPVTFAADGRIIGVQPQSQEWRFTQLWTAAHPTVAGFVRGLVPDRAAVDDILQEVAVALFAQFADYDQTRPFVAWALGIAKHKIQDRWRSLARSKQVVQDAAVLEAMAEISAEMDDEFEARRAALQECLSQVQGRASDLLRLHYHEGLEPRHIAEQLGLQAGHVRVLLNRVRGVLRDCIERRIGLPEGSRP